MKIGVRGVVWGGERVTDGRRVVWVSVGGCEDQETPTHTHNESGGLVKEVGYARGHEGGGGG